MWLGSSITAIRTTYSQGTWCAVTPPHSTNIWQDNHAFWPQKLTELCPKNQVTVLPQHTDTLWAMSNPTGPPQFDTPRLHNTISYPTGKQQLLAWRNNTLLTLLLAP
jgi:hypothetical protein